MSYDHRFNSHARLSAFIGLLVGICVGACVTPDPLTVGKLCDEDHPCPDGLACIAGLCSQGEGGDASSGSNSDAGSSPALTIRVIGTGTTSPEAGTHTYAPGATVRVTATSESGATFMGWSGAATGTTNPVTLTMDGTKTLTATFSKTTVLTITTSGNGTTSPAAGRTMHTAGTSVQVSATAASGAIFTGWSGAATGTTNPITITMDGDKTLTASFATAYTLTITTSGSGTTTPALGSTTYASGTVVQVTATAGSGAIFTGWSGAVSGTSNPVTLTMNENKTLSASFGTAYTLTIATIGSGTTNPGAGTYTLTSGATVQVRAIAGSTAVFNGWSGALTGTANPVTLTMSGDKTLTANFTGANTLTLATSGNGTTTPSAGSYTYGLGTSLKVTATAGTGAVFTGWSGTTTSTSNPLALTMDTNKALTASFATAYTLSIATSGNGTTSPAAGSATYASGTRVQVTANAGGGAVFTGWSGAATGTTNPVTLTMDGNKTLSASFAPVYTLSIASNGTGTTSPAAGTYKYTSGARVEVTATAGSGALFTGWSGAATGTTNPVTLTMDGDKTLTATFTRPKTLTLSTIGNGTTSPTAGTYTYAPGAVVQVTATAVSGASFTGWSGAATGTTNPAALTMDGDKTLTARFTGPNTLTLSTTGSGTTSPAAGTYTYASGATVKVTATAGSGASFTGWSGAATGTKNPVTLTMDGDKTLTATFTQPNTLTLATNGNGTTSPTAGTYTYTSGATVKVTATAGSGASFIGWSGAATGRTNPVTLTMDGDKTLTASFATEICNSVDDDGNGTVDDGCPANLSFCCDVTGTRYGGSGGDPFSNPCPSGKVLVGFNGHSGDKTNMLVGLCATTSIEAVSGTPENTYRVQTSDVTRLPKQGGSGGDTYWDMQCGDGKVVIGLHGRSGKELNNFGMQCGRITVGRDDTGAWIATVTLTDVSRTFGGPDGSAFSYACPDGMIGTGFVGRSAERIDQGALICSKVSVLLVP